MQLPGKITYSLIMSLACCALGFGFHLVSLVTPFWNLTSYKENEYIRDGIWKRCVKFENIKGFVCSDLKEEDISGLFRTVQASALLGLLFILIGGVATAGSVFLAKEKKGHTKLLRFAVVIDHLAMIAVVVTIVVFGVDSKENAKIFKDNPDVKVVFGFSYVLDITTAGLMLMTGIMAEIHIRFKDEGPNINYHLNIENRLTPRKIDPQISSIEEPSRTVEIEESCKL